MRKIYYYLKATLLLYLLIPSVGLKAQVSSYNFTESAGTFTALTGATAIWSVTTDDAVSANITIPFTFTYSGTGYTGCKVSTNGFLTLGTGTTPSTTVYTPISSTGAAYNTAISALARDLSTTAKYQTLGTSPNRIFVVEWTGYRLAVGSTESISVQVKLYETTNVVEIQYGTISTTNTTLTTGTCEVGLKSASAVYNNVTLTNAALTGYSYTNNWNSLVTGAAQSDIVGITTTVLPASGTTLRWTPSSCTQVTTAATASSVTSNSAVVTWTNSATYASGYKIRWRKVDETYAASTWATPVSVAAGSSSYTITGLTPSTYYVYSIEGQCSASSANNYSPVTTSNTTNGKGLFMTTCTALNVPYSENFDGVTQPAFPSCMGVENANADASAWKTCTSTSLGNSTAIAPNSGTNQMGIAYNTSAAMNDWFFLPGINLTGGTAYRLTFYVRGYTALTEQLEVKYGTTQSSAGMTAGTIMASTAITGGNAYTQMSLVFTPGSSTVYYVGFHGISAANQWYLFVDDITLTVAGPLLSANTLTGFGNVCTNTTAGPNSFTITGSLLTAANITVSNLPGYTFSTTSGGTYTSSLSLTQPGGNYSQQIFVKFNPALVQSYNGNIVVGGGGATSINVAVTGSGINTVATVTAGTATGITSSGATVAGSISVTGCTAITGYGIEYSTTNGFANGTGIAVSSSNLSGGNFSSILSGLNPSTVYYFHAYAINSGGTAYSTQGTFTTVCNAINPPYSQNFDGVTQPAIPTCMSVENTNADANAWKTCTSTSLGNGTAITPNSGTNQMGIAYNSSSAMNDWFFLPGINLTAGTTYQLSFYVRGYTGLTEQLEIKYGTTQTAAGMTTGTIMSATSIAGGNPYTLMSFSFTPNSSNVFYIGFHGLSIANQWYLFVDDINLVTLLPCTTPTDQPVAMALTSVTSTSLNVSFTAASPAPSGYVVFRSTSSTAPTLTNGTTYTVGSSYTISGNSYTAVSSGTSTSFTQTGLSPNTTYYYYAFSYNSACIGQPYYLNTSPATANTLTCTAAPATLTGTTINSTSATINFAAVAGASNYVLQYSVAGANAWITASPSPVNSPYTLTGLTAGTAYDIKMEGPNSACGTTLTTSNAFTTTCAVITSLPWSEKFDGMATIGSGIVPSCWTHVAGTKSFVSSNASYTTYHDPYSGVNYMTIAYGTTTASVLWTPGFQLTAGVSYDFSFKWAGDGFAGWTGDVLRNTSASATGAAVLGTFVTSAATTATSYNTVTYTFTAPSTGTYYFGTRVSSTGSPWYLGFDDYSLKVTPPCNYAGTTSAGSNSICSASGSTTLTATDYSVNGAGLAYNWQISSDNITFTDIPGATNPASYSTGTINATKYYRLRVFCTSLGNSYSNVQTIAVGSYSILSSSGATRCGVGTVNLTATATAGATISWYDSPSGGTTLGTGNSFTTPEISTTTTYYAGANNGVAAATIGATYSGSGNNGTAVTAHGVVIATTSPNIVIVSAKIPFTGKGTFTIELQTTAGVTVSSVTTAEITGNASIPVTVPLNIAVTTPGTYRLIVTAITGTIDELGYISNAVYPYTGLGGAFSITSGYWWGNDANDNMYLFSLVVTNLCEGARAAVTATVTAAPSLTINPTAATICSGSSTTISVTSPASNFTTYSWSPSTGVTASGSPSGTSVTLNPTSTTNYILTATNASNCVNKVSALITVNAAPPTTTGAAVCSGSNATISALSSCASYGNPTLQINGNYDAAVDPVAPRPIIYIANSPTCNFDASVIRNYTTQDFQVTVSGTYTFVMPNTTAFDGMGYIVVSNGTIGTFVPGICPGAGQWIVGDDDSGPTTFEPFMTATLTAGVTYTLITTTYSSSSGTYTGPYTWNITAPVGGFITTVSGGTLQWYTAASGGSSISSASPFNPVGAAGSGITSNTQVGSYTFYAACSNNPTCRTATGYVIGSPGQWIGNTSTDWSNTLNWCGGVPTISTDAGISLGAPNMPVLSTGTGTVKNLTVNTGATLTVNNATMQIAGTITASNNITASAGTIELAGATAQSISGSSFTTRSIKNIIASNDVNVSSALNDSLKITGVLSFGNVNSKTFNSGNNLILASSATGTAMVADITNNGVNSGNSFTGNFQVQRYIPARRAWRLMTAPLTAGAQTINQAWQENVGGTWSSNPAPGYGTHITGGVTRTTVQGFDQGPRDPSIYGFTATGWNYLPATTNELVTGRQGWMLFIRGSRAINLPTSTPSTAADITVLRPIGAIKFGTQPALNNATGGYMVVGNPYPAPVNFKNISRTGVLGGLGGNNAYTLWDPALGGSSGVGAFVAFAWNGSSYTKSIITGSGSSSIGTDGMIPSSAAFMVNQSAGGTMSFEENDKDTAVYTNSYLFRPSGAESSLRVSLCNTEQDGNISVHDGNVILFNENSSAAVDYEDVVKVTNARENIALYTGGDKLSIEFRNNLQVNDTIFYRMWNMRQRHYDLEITLTNITLPGNCNAVLEDMYLQQKTILNIDTNRIGFDITADTASSVQSRFRILIEPSGVVPVTFMNIKAYQTANNIMVEWKVENEISISHYDIERSTDGIRFYSIGNINADGGLAPYTFPDPTPLNDINYYRIKSVDNNGRITYSRIVSIRTVRGKPAITVYPNPVTNNIINIAFTNIEPGNYQLNLYNSAGQLVFNRQINHSTESGMESILLSGHIAKGAYHLEITGANTKKEIIKLTIQ